MKKGLSLGIIITFSLLLTFSLVSANIFSDFFNKLFGNDEASLSPFPDVYVDNYCAQVGGYDVFSGVKTSDGYGISESILKNCYSPLDNGEWSLWTDVPASCQNYVCALYRGIADGVLTSSTTNKKCAQENGFPSGYEENCLTWCPSLLNQIWDGSKCIVPEKSAVCGNNILESGEECDTQKLNSQTCVTKGFDGGILRCGANCVFDVSSCITDPECGDGVCNGIETSSSCSIDCLNPTAFCGDGNIDIGEQCDDKNTAPGDGCNGVCQINSRWSCSYDNNLKKSVCSEIIVGVESCGNGIVDIGELCDGDKKSCTVDGKSGSQNCLNTCNGYSRCDVHITEEIENSCSDYSNSKTNCENDGNINVYGSSTGLIISTSDYPAGCPRENIERCNWNALSGTCSGVVERNVISDESDSDCQEILPPVQEGVCLDSDDDGTNDGIDFYSPGSVTIDGKLMGSDICVGNKVLREYYCDLQTGKPNVIDTICEGHVDYSTPERTTRYCDTRLGYGGKCFLSSDTELCDDEAYFTYEDETKIDNTRFPLIGDNLNLRAKKCDGTPLEGTEYTIYKTGTIFFFIPNNRVIETGVVSFEPILFVPEIAGDYYFKISGNNVNLKSNTIDVTNGLLVPESNLIYGETLPKFENLVWTQSGEFIYEGDEDENYPSYYKIRKSTDREFISTKIYPGEGFKFKIIWNSGVTDNSQVGDRKVSLILKDSSGKEYFKVESNCKVETQASVGVAQRKDSNNKVYTLIRNNLELVDEVKNGNACRTLGGVTSAISYENRGTEITIIPISMSGKGKVILENGIKLNEGPEYEFDGIKEALILEIVLEGNKDQRMVINNFEFFSAGAGEDFEKRFVNVERNYPKRSYIETLPVVVWNNGREYLGDKYAAIGVDLVDEDDNYLGTYIAYKTSDEIGRGIPVEISLQPSFTIDELIGFPFKLEGTNYQLRYLASVHDISELKDSLFTESKAKSTKSSAVKMTKDFCVGCGELEEEDCGETDGNFNLLSKGVITFLSNENSNELSNQMDEFEMTERCIDDSVLIENSCQTIYGGNLGRTYYGKMYWWRYVDCGEGNCNDGKCINDDNVCGNGVLEDDEECDGNDFNGNTCSTYGFSGGYLRCKYTRDSSDNCKIDRSQCYGGISTIPSS